MQRQPYMHQRTYMEMQILRANRQNMYDNIVFFQLDFQGDLKTHTHLRTERMDGGMGVLRWREEDEQRG